MRFLVLAFALLLPLVSQSQFLDFNKFEEGSYVLATNRNVRHPGLLKLHNGGKLLLKAPDGKKTKFKPEQVSSFQIGQRHYTTARNFHVQAGFGMAMEEAFVEQLDSGRVVLMQYEYTIGSGTMGGTTSMSAYLLRRSTDDTFVAVQPGAYTTAGGNHFRDAVRPFLADYPDLVKLLDGKRITMDNLPAVIHAINSNTPYSLPPTQQEALKQQAFDKQARKAADDAFDSTHP